MAIGDFYKLPGDTPKMENVLEPGDLITHVEIAPVAHSRQVYLKLRDRASYEFALSSAAVVAQVEGGHIRSVRVAMGGVERGPGVPMRRRLCLWVNRRPWSTSRRRLRLR